METKTDTSVRVTKVSRNKPPAILLVTSGATGSGKSSLIHQTFKQVLGYVPDFAMFLVDDLVEKDESYKKMVDDILTTHICVPPFNTVQCDVSKPTEALLLAFKSAYFAVRSKAGCMKNRENLNCNELNDKNIIAALKAHQHVVIETTGSYVPSWILDLEFKNYKVIFSYSTVQFDTLLERNASRAYQQFTAYFNDRTRPGPRLVDIRKSTFLPIVTQIYATLLELRDLCMIDASTETLCKSKKSMMVSNATVDNLLIYDNTGKDFRNIYDHKNPDHAGLSEYKFQTLAYNAFFGPKF